jgi:inhibitor of KinA
MITPRFRAIADHAVLVEFGDQIADATHAAVLHLDAALAATPCLGLREAVPAYVSLMVDFDPLLTDHDSVTAHLRNLLSAKTAAPKTPTQHDVAVCYDDGFAPDLDMVAHGAGLTREAAINAHLAGDYRVFMYGFAPGYAYLAGVPSALQRDRKPSPVRGVAAGSVIIAGPQCLITTLVMPTGWWIMGRTATRVLTGKADRPFLFDVGDQVIFRRIAARELDGRDG